MAVLELTTQGTVMKTPYINYNNRPTHRFSILWSDDGYGNLIRVLDIDTIVYFVNGGFGVGGL